MDGHTHFHPCFSWETFLDSTARNFSDVRRKQGVSAESPGCLLLTESAGADAFQSLLRNGVNGVRRWSLDIQDESDSILLRHESGETIIVVPGRQVVTAEKLEVLALGSIAQFPDGQPIRAVLRSVTRHGAVLLSHGGWENGGGDGGELFGDADRGAPGSSVLPWRQRRSCASWLPRPWLFQTADNRGIPVLAGSDPLPLPHMSRAQAVMASCSKTGAETVTAGERHQGASPSTDALTRGVRASLLDIGQWCGPNSACGWQRRRSVLRKAV